MERKAVKNQLLNIGFIPIALLIIFVVFSNSKAQSNNFEQYILNGDKFQSKFENKKALKEYQKAYQAAPDNYETLLRLARVYNDIGEDLNSDESEKYYQKAIEYAEKMKKLFPDSSMTYFYLAGGYGNLALFKGGKEKVKYTQIVERNLKRALKLDPDFDQIYMALGIYYREVANLSWILKVFAETFFGEIPPGTNEDAVKMLSKAIELNPDVIGNHYELALTYLEMDEEDEAAKHLKKVVNLPLSDHLDSRKVKRARELLSDL